MAQYADQLHGRGVGGIDGWAGRHGIGHVATVHQDASIGSVINPAGRHQAHAGLAITECVELNGRGLGQSGTDGPDAGEVGVGTLGDLCQDRRERLGGRGLQGLDAGQYVLLPGQALELPRPEPNKDGECDGDGDREAYREPPAKSFWVSRHGGLRTPCS